MHSWLGYVFHSRLILHFREDHWRLLWHRGHDLGAWRLRESRVHHGSEALGLGESGLCRLGLLFAELLLRGLSRHHGASGLHPNAAKAREQRCVPLHDCGVRLVLAQEGCCSAAPELIGEYVVHRVARHFALKVRANRVLLRRKSVLAPILTLASRQSCHM